MQNKHTAMKNFSTIEYSNKDPFFHSWNDKWNTFISERLDGSERFKYLIILSETAHTYLKYLRFKKAFWENKEKGMFYIQFTHPDYPSINFVFKGTFGTPFINIMNPPKDIPTNELNFITSALLRFDLSNMINYGDAL